MNPRPYIVVGPKTPSLYTVSFWTQTKENGKFHEQGKGEPYVMP